jgi:hypothetical protein
MYFKKRFTYMAELVPVLLDLLVFCLTELFHFNCEALLSAVSGALWVIQSISLLLNEAVVSSTVAKRLTSATHNNQQQNIYFT